MTAGLGERTIAKFIDDHALKGSSLDDDLFGVSLGPLCNETIDQIDGFIEPNPLVTIDGVDPKRDGYLRFAGMSSANQAR